jgi:hypothetical protein
LEPYANIRDEEFATGLLNPDNYRLAAWVDQWRPDKRATDAMIRGDDLSRDVFNDLLEISDACGAHDSVQTNVGSQGGTSIHSILVILKSFFTNCISFKIVRALRDGNCDRDLAVFQHFLSRVFPIEIERVVMAAV